MVIHIMKLDSSLGFIASDVDPVRMVPDMYNDTLPYWKDLWVTLPRNSGNEMFLK